MKTLIPIIFIALLIACGKNDSARVNVTDPYVPPVVTEPEDPIGGMAKTVCFYNAGTIYMYDTQSVYAFKTGTATPAGFRTVALDGVKYTTDDIGNVTSQVTLPFQPDLCAGDWTVKVIPPAEAYASGMLYKCYSKFYCDNVEYSTVQMQTTGLFCTENDVIAITDLGGYYCVTSDKPKVTSAVEDGFTVWGSDTDAHTINIEDTLVSYGLNFFTSAKYWISDGVKWYSQNGYTWDGSTLGQNITALNCWNYTAQYPIDYIPGEYAVIISAGSAILNGETVMFFIECNSGWMFRYNPGADTLVKEFRLYTGDSYRSTGIAYSKMLKPVTTSDGVYFIFDGGIYRYRFDVKSLGYIAECDGWLRRWK